MRICGDKYQSYYWVELDSWRRGRSRTASHVFYFRICFGHLVCFATNFLCTSTSISFWHLTLIVCMFICFWGCMWYLTCFHFKYQFFRWGNNVCAVVLKKGPQLSNSSFHEIFKWFWMAHFFFLLFNEMVVPFGFMNVCAHPFPYAPPHHKTHLVCESNIQF